MFMDFQCVGGRRVLASVEYRYLEIHTCRVSAIFSLAEGMATHGRISDKKKLSFRNKIAVLTDCELGEAASCLALYNNS